MHRFCPGCWRDTFEEGEYRALWSSRANNFLPESQQVTPWYQHVLELTGEGRWRLLPVETYTDNAIIYKGL